MDLAPDDLAGHKTLFEQFNVRLFDFYRILTYCDVWRPFT